MPETFFPEIDPFLGSTGVGIVVVESKLDLALVQFTRHEASGVYSAEHFMALFTKQDGQWHGPCGS